MNTEVIIELYNTSTAWLRDANIQTIGGEFRFTEGPVWHPGNYFLFSDTPANNIYRFSGTGDCQVYLENSGGSGITTADSSDQIGSNGLAIDNHENLLICQHGNHAIALLDHNKALTIIADSYQGRPFNSPNDIIVRKDGIIFFTDPPYGLKDQSLHPKKFQPQAGVYAIHEGIVSLVANELKYPNGLFFSPDESMLFVSSNHPDQQYILRYKMIDKGGLSYDGIFMPVNADGMTTDKAGNIYLATDDGVLIVSPTAEKLALISLPETPSNLAWGGRQQEILLVTARSRVYTITCPL